MDITQQKELVRLLKSVQALEEYKGFVTDICYDYKDQSDLGLMAIRVLSKGRQTEEVFREVWLKWRDNKGLSVLKEKEDEI